MRCFFTFFPTATYYITLLFLLHLSTPIHAQKYAYTQYHTDYLSPFQSAKAVVQDSLGYLWIGSQEGLFRFDGADFRDRSDRLKGRHIHAFTDHYFVSDGGLYRMEGDSIHLTLLAALEQSDSTLFYPNQVFEASDGMLWISESNHTAVRYNKVKLEKFSLSSSKQANQIQFQEDRWGNVWALSSKDGLYLFDQSEQTFVLKRPFEGAKTFSVVEDMLLLGGKNLQWFRLDERHRLNKLRQWDTGTATITAVAQDKKGQYLIGTAKSGLFSLVNERSELEQIFGANDPQRVEDLDFGDIHDIYVSPDSISSNGAIWVASDNGLWLLQRKYFENVESLPKAAPRSIACNDNGTVWISYANLYQVQNEDDQFKASDFELDVPVNTVLADGNEIWVTTSEKEILHFRNQSLLRKYDLSERGEGLFSLYKDRRANIWFCQAPSLEPIIGLGKIDEKGQLVFYESDAGLESRILVLKEDDRGTLYAAGIGANSYLYRYDEATGRFENISLTPNFKLSLNFEVHDIAIDHRGVIWMATTDGLLVYDGEKVVRLNIPPLQKIEVRAVCIGERGSVWAATATKGLVYYNYLEENYVAFGEASGLPSRINIYRCLKRDASNRIWVGTGEGVVHSNVSQLTPAVSIAPRITALKVNDKNFNLTTDVKLYEHSRLDIQFNTLAFPGDQIQYQYRLLPADEADFVGENDLWLSLANENRLLLPEQALGTYLLQVRAKQKGGYLWSPITSKRIVVQQVWYKKWWIIAGASALILFLFGSSIRLFLLQRIRALERLLSRQKAELAVKESVIQAQYETLDDQQEELAEAMSNIATLYLITSKIEPNASWEAVIEAIGKAIEQAIGIEAFELAFVEDTSMKYIGYSNQETDKFTTRSGAFNPKNSLTSFALANEQDLLINDFDEEHLKYVAKKKRYRFQSMLFIPFQLLHGQKIVICAYHTAKAQFGKRDVLMLKVLADYLRLSTRDVLE